MRLFAKRLYLRARQILALAALVAVALIIVTCTSAQTRTGGGRSRAQPKPNYGKKIIVSWNGFFDMPSFMVPDLRKLRCAVQDCHVTADRGMLDVSDALVIHWHDARLDDLPPERRPYQRWILMTFEPPMYAPEDVLARLGPTIDWTATYRLDSDVPTPYGLVVPRKSGNPFPAEVTNEQDGRLPVAWMNSHCLTHGRREELADQLARFIRIDVYGRCRGNLSLRGASPDQAFAFLAKRYVFYLSFENSVCRDYVTEKAFQPLHHGLIPVVYGGADYQRHLPAGSFVNALDFGSAEDLALHLHSVRRNRTLYSGYFLWRRDYRVVRRACSNEFFCEICRKLHQEPRTCEKELGERKNLTLWWNPKRDCVRPRTGRLEEARTVLRSKIDTWYDRSHGPNLDVPWKL